MIKTKNEFLATDEDMPFLLMAMQAAPDLAIDTETTGLNVRNGVDYLTGICVDTGDRYFYIPFRHNTDNVSMKWLEPLKELFKTKDLIWHNQKFDYHSLRTIGFDPTTFKGKQYDTLLIAHLVNEELYSFQLDALCKWYLKEQKAEGDEIHKLGEIYGWANIPPEVIARYGATDARLTRRLRDYLWPKLVAQGLQSVYFDTESPYSLVLYKVEQRGVGTNRDLSSRMAERGRLRMATIHRGFKFNPSSTTDLGHYLLEELGLPVLARTPKGKPSFNKKAMEQYDEILQASNNPAARLIAEYRGWQKAVTSLYEPLLAKVGPDGRIRTEFKQHGTVTGRLSASDPNLQQVPRGSDKAWNGNAKGCFTSGREGYALYGWDYSQVELRLAAAYGRESLLLADFAKPDGDPFRTYCEILFGKFTPEGRQNTKTFFYANLYGAGLDKIAATLGWSRSDTEPIFNRFRASIPGIAAISRQVNDAMARQNYITYWDGRKRHIKNKEDTHKAWNSVIQGGAAQMMKQAMIRCEEWADDDCYPVLTVHDEITFCVRREAIKDYEPKVTKSMTEWKNEFGGDLFPVNFAIDGKEWKAAA